MSSARRALVTGASGSIGLAVAKTLAAEGFAVTGTYFRNRPVRDVDQVEWMHLDLEEGGEFELEGYDTVINAAGVNITDASTAAVSIADWRRTLEINLTGAFRISKAALKYMVENGFGRIVNINSIYGRSVTEGNLPYCVSKFGLSALTRTVAREYGKFGITCNEVCPGPVDSRLLEAIAVRDAGAMGKIDREQVDVFYKYLKQDIPTGRLATPEDIASAVSFFVSRETSQINGASLILDGGETCL